MSRKRGFRLLSLVLVLPLAGCLTWSPAGMNAEALLQQPEPPDRIRVVDNEGVAQILERPVIRAGAIVATAAPGAILIRDITSLEVETVSVARSIGLALPGVIILTVVGIRAAR